MYRFGYFLMQGIALATRLRRGISSFHGHSRACRFDGVLIAKVKEREIAGAGIFCGGYSRGSPEFDADS